MSPLDLALCVQLGFSRSLGRQRNSQVTLESSCPGSFRGWVSEVSLGAMQVSSCCFPVWEGFSWECSSSLCIPRCILVFWYSEEIVSPGGKAMLGSHYSSFLWGFFFKTSAPKIEPPSPVSITCAIIQLGLFYSMRTPPEPVTDSSSAISCFPPSGEVCSGRGERELFWWKLGAKSFLGQLILCLGSQKMGCAQKSPLQLEIWGGLFQTGNWEGLFLQFCSRI